MNSPGKDEDSTPSGVPPLLRVAALIVLLYVFLVSIGLLGSAFKLFGSGFTEQLVRSVSSPLSGLFVGILATTLVQSSSTTTSLVVALVGAGTMPVTAAISVIMGANIGTSVTNTLVSLGHVTRGREFHRAFSASTVHDFFNLGAVALLFPLHWATGFLEHIATFLADTFQSVGGMTFSSPLKMLTKPAVKGLTDLLHDHPWLLLLVALIFMFGSLRYLVVVLKSLVLQRVESFFDLVIFKNAGRAMIFGLIITVLVQSSSITTSLVIPLAGAGILNLRQIFPYTLGANVGTTITAMLAALAVGEIGAVTVAFAHVSFNLSGIALIWPIKVIREIPIRMSTWLADLSMQSRWIPLLYIVCGFYLIPFLVILVMR